MGGKVTNDSSPPAACPILVNPLAGRRGVDAVEGMARTLAATETPVDIRPLEPAELMRELGALVAEGVDTIGVSGGDGTLRAAAALLVGSRTALLPIPSGTLNHFARRFGIARPEDAAAALRRGSVASVPVGILDDRVFLNTATFGSYADVVRKRERLRRFLTKWPAAAVAFFEVLSRGPHHDVVLEIEGEALRRSTPLLWVGIGWGSFPRILQATERRHHPDLEVVILRPEGRRGALSLLGRLTLNLLRGGDRPVADPALELVHARSLVIHSPRPIGVTLDGEERQFEPPLFVAVQDDALRVLVPR